tara:strand:+ start:813 stop:1016 length:204 start_codon:yes stop_codon:yes gene_type:complete
MEKKIEFTQEEAINLLALLNISLKTEGMNIAKTVVYFQDKFEKAFAEDMEKARKNGIKKVKKEPVNV